MSNLNKQSQGFVGALTMSSREIADLVEARHNDVVATIERLFSKNLLRSSRKTRKEATGGRPTEVYDLCQRDTHMVVAGYSDEHRAKVIDRWQELEAQVAKTTLPSNYIESLEALLESEKEKVQIAFERDEAVRTKAQIGSRREATAMATASAAKREAQMLLHELGRNQHHATVRAVERATGEKFARNAYVELRRWCKRQNVVAQDVPDERHGSVKAWPAGAWLEAFDINLSALFGIDRSGGGNTGSLSHG